MIILILSNEDPRLLTAYDASLSIQLLLVESHERCLLTTALRGNYPSPGGLNHRISRTDAKDLPLRH